MTRIKLKSLITGILALVAVGVIGWVLFEKYSHNEESKDKVEKRESKDIIFARKLGRGINIGNSLDSTGMKRWHEDATDLDYETYWHNEPISKELFVMIKNAGFSSVRIPVSWDEHLDADGKISEVWLGRVTEVVDMAMKQNLYVVLNTHHETWLSLDTGNKEEIISKFIKVWQQISVKFMDYDEHLIFEAMNEPRLQESDIEWTEGTYELREMVNELNNAFYNTVRESGGKNGSRYLMIPTYCNSVKEEAISQLSIPGDKIIVSVHGYKPYNFCFVDENAKEWNNEESGTGDSKEKISEFFSDLDYAFIQNGIPVVITEFAVCDSRALDQRLEWLDYYLSQADAHSINCMWWDDGKDYKIMDRKSFAWCYSGIVNKIVGNK